MKGRFVTKAVSYAVITQCDEFQHCTCEQCIKRGEQHVTDIKLFETPCIVIVTDEFERTFDGRGMKMYRHGLTYNIFKRLSAALKCYAKHSEWKLPNGMDVGMDKCGSHLIEVR